MTFDEALKRTFRFLVEPETDNLPILAFERTHARDRSGLAKLCADMGLATGVEIGTADGNSAKLWCDTNPALRLTCVDPYVAYDGRQSRSRNEDIYKKTCRDLESYSNITLLRETSMAAVSRFKDCSIDFLHIDGDHCFDTVVLDLVCWIPKVRKGGLISIHDYYPFRRAGVMKAIDAYTHCHRIDPWYVVNCETPTAFWQKGAERCG